MKKIEITLINYNGSRNIVFNKIINSINTYLLRNKSSVSDFNLIKDIVDRNTDALDEEINSLLPIPLYLGLMGTMIGIVVGLFSMPSISDSNFENAIDLLIGGVKIAMIASFTGLLMTVILSGWKYKGAKANAEAVKNDFFTWIQTNLLPVLSENISSSIYSLQSNLQSFNHTFSSNIERFDVFMNKIVHSFDSQSNLLAELKNIDVVQLAQLNINVFQELRTSAKEFEKFNMYITQLNHLTLNTQELNHHISNQLQKTHAIENIAGAINTNVETNTKIIEILRSEINEIGTRKQIVTNAVIDIDTSIRKMLDNLKNNIQEQVHLIRQEQPLVKLFQQDSKSSGELQKLDELKNVLNKIQDQTQNQNTKIDRLIFTISNPPKSPLQTLENLFNKKNLPKLLGGFIVGSAILVSVVLIWIKTFNWIVN